MRGWTMQRWVWYCTKSSRKSCFEESAFWIGCASDGLSETLDCHTSFERKTSTWVVLFVFEPNKDNMQHTQFMIVYAPIRSEEQLPLLLTKKCFRNRSSEKCSTLVRRSPQPFFFITLLQLHPHCLRRLSPRPIDL